MHGAIYTSLLMILAFFIVYQQGYAMFAFTAQYHISYPPVVYVSKLVLLCPNSTDDMFYISFYKFLNHRYSHSSTTNIEYVSVNLYNCVVSYH